MMATGNSQLEFANVSTSQHILPNIGIKCMYYCVIKLTREMMSCRVFYTCFILPSCLL